MQTPMMKLSPLETPEIALLRDVLAELRIMHITQAQMVDELRAMRADYALMHPAINITNDEYVLTDNGREMIRAVVGRGEYGGTVKD